MSNELLDLSTIADRNTINVKSKQHPAGKLYEMVNESELSLWDAGRIQAKAADLQDVDVNKKQTPAQERNHTAALRALVQMIVPGLEKPVLHALGDLQLFAIYGVFLGARAEADTGKNLRSGRTSAASSPASKSSTAATRKRGTAAQGGS